MQGPVVSELIDFQITQKATSNKARQGISKFFPLRGPLYNSELPSIDYGLLWYGAVIWDSLSIQVGLALDPGLLLLLLLCESSAHRCG